MDEINTTVKTLMVWIVASSIRLTRFLSALATPKVSLLLTLQIGTKGADKSSMDYALKDFGSAIVRKAIQRIEFYEFSNLKVHLPKLTSVHEFITSENYLGRVKMEVSGLPEQIKNLSPDEKLDATIQVLTVISEVIASDKIEYKGSKKFSPRMVRDVFSDKTLNFMVDDGGDKEFGRSMNDPAETAYHLDLSTRAWFAFDDCFGTSEEKLLIQYIDKRYAELSKVYSEAYLIRNRKALQALCV